MQRIIRPIVISGLLVSGAVAVPRALLPHAAAKTAGIAVQLKVSGDLQYKETLAHSEDNSYTIPSMYSCVRFTHPNFAPKGKPLAYGLNFGNADVRSGKPGIHFSFYYNASSLAGQRVDGAGESSLQVVPAANVAFGPGGQGTFTVTVHLSKDLRSGSFKATNFRNLLGAGTVTIEGTWSCPRVFVQTS